MLRSSGAGGSRAAIRPMRSRSSSRANRLRRRTSRRRPVSKILFVPFSVIGGLLAGTIAKKTFQRLWSLVDDHESPEPVRGLFDRGTREVFSRLTATWPGEDAPKPA